MFRRRSDFCCDGDNSLQRRDMSRKNKREKHVTVAHCSSDSRLPLSLGAANKDRQQSSSRGGVQSCTSLDSSRERNEKDKNRREKPEREMIQLDNYLKDIMERHKISRTLRKYCTDTPPALRRDPQILKKHRPGKHLEQANANALRGSSRPLKQTPAIREARPSSSRVWHIRRDAGRNSSTSSSSSSSTSGGDDRVVSFSSVQIRSYETILGDSPSCSEGPPLSIGWRYDPQSTLLSSVDDYEESKIKSSQRPPRLRGRHELELFLPRSARESMLHKVGYSREEVDSATAACRRIRCEQSQSIRESLEQAHEKEAGMDSFGPLICMAPFSSTGDIGVASKWRARHRRVVTTSQLTITKGSKRHSLRRVSVPTSKKEARPRHRCQSTSDLVPTNEQAQQAPPEGFFLRSCQHENAGGPPPPSPSPPPEEEEDKKQRHNRRQMYYEAACSSQLNASWPLLTAQRSDPSLNSERALPQARRLMW